MERICDVVNRLRPALLMVAAQLSFAGVNVFYKLAANDGMNLKVIVAYRFIFATAFGVPMALIFGRYIYLSLYIILLTHLHVSVFLFNHSIQK